MGDSHVVFDISSDEEKGFDEPEGDDFSWLSKLLCDEVDDSDEVVVVGEIKSKSSKSTVNNEDDDDCVVLDADPDKVVSARNDKAGEGEREGKLQGDGDDDGDGDGEEDDLVVVGERGQIACRDFPHPRHLCAKFPFSSTAHELHCDQCHCYVCDSVAPCAHWDSGVCDIDHCHATEKEEFWKSQRKNFRLKRDAPLPVKVPDTSLCTTFPQLNQIPPRDIIRLSNCVPQNQHSRPGIVRTCSSSNRLNIPNIISQGRSRQSGPVFGKNRLQTRIVSQQSPLLRVRNNVIRRDRGLNGGNLGMFRRPGIAGDASTMNQSVYGSANNTRGVHASEITCAPHPRATSTDGINMRYVPSMSQDSCTYQNLSQTGTGSVFVSTVPSQSPVYSQTIPEPQPYSQPMSQQPIYSQPIPQLPIYSQPIPELQVSSESVPQPHGYVEHISQSNDSLLIGELGNQRQNTAGPNLSDFDPWVNVCGSNQQPPNENCHLHRTGSTNEPLLFQELNSHCNGGTKFHYSDHEFDDVWFQENHAVQVPEAYAPAHFVDAGMLLFDFETSFNGLAHV